MVGQNSFKVEYKRGTTMGGGVFSRGVKMHVDIMMSGQSESIDNPLYVVQFTLLAGMFFRMVTLSIFRPRSKIQTIG